MDRRKQHDTLQAAAAAIAQSEALLIGAGAGMGVDSGLPDFRGNEGFWRAYPPFRELGFSFYDLANPRWFDEDPAMAWGFYGHRLELYQSTHPHPGFDTLRKWADQKRYGCFVFTSNVDGHFQKAGFPMDRIVECHGAINQLQCSRLCNRQIWPAEFLKFEIDTATFRSNASLPTCPTCQSVARPNILMFGDFEWLAERTELQLAHYSRWLASLPGDSMTVIEIGAGTAVPTVRGECEQQSRLRSSDLIRINPREPETGGCGISIKLGALEALQELDALISQGPASAT